jgi:hypothetical protein
MQEETDKEKDSADRDRVGTARSTQTILEASQRTQCKAVRANERADQTSNASNTYPSVRVSTAATMIAATIRMWRFAMFASTLQRQLPSRKVVEVGVLRGVTGQSAAVAVPFGGHRACCFW